MLATLTRTAIVLVTLLAVGADASVLAARLHVIVVADDEDSIAQHTNISSLYVEQAIEANIPFNQIVKTTIQGADFRTSKILAAIADLAPANDEAILFYYVGHGAITDEGKPYMVCGKRRGERDLNVATAMTRLAQRGAHALIGVFDMCSVCPKCNVAGYLGAAPANRVSPLFTSLFFSVNASDSNHCVISSSRGQPALTLAPISPTERYDGGMYSWCFAKHLADHAGQPSTFSDLHKAVRQDVASASKWHPYRERLTNRYDRKQIPVLYNVWQRQ